MSLGGIIVAAFLGVPLMTLAHELGHAAAALHFTSGRVGVRVGGVRGSVRMRYRRLIVAFSPLGAGGFCRREQRGSRSQALAITLAGPTVNAALAAALVLAGANATGTMRAVLWTLAGLNGLYVLNLIPRRSTRNPITRGLPSDGLRAWCLIRNRPVPPADPNRGRGGLRDPLTRSQVAGVVLGTMVGMILAASKLGGVALAFWAPLALQTVLSGSTKRPSKTAMGTATPAAKQPLGGGTSTAAEEALKTCPRCGARVRSGASLCYCYHRFDDAPAVTG